jgi:quinol monooxygenase YgiN
MTTQNKQTIKIDLGFIGNKAEKFQDLYNTYTTEPNKYGYFLRFENYTDLEPNKGVYVMTNCWESEEDFKEDLTSKLLLNF